MSEIAALPSRPSLRLLPDGATARSIGFVGRAHEITQLAATYERVRDGQAAAVLVSGDAGIGKTRLVDELSRQAREAGATVATGRCVRSEDGLPYAPAVGLARELVRRLGREASDALAPLVAGVGVDPGAAPGGAYTAEDPMRHNVARMRMFESILAGLSALADRGPLVLIVEDLHWADAASVELIDFLVRNLVEASVLLAITYRSEDLERGTRAVVAELARHPRVTALRLGGMTRPEIASVVAARVGHVADARIADAIWERSEGNPFFAEELASAPAGTHLPPDLRDVLLLQVDALSPHARRIVQAAAAAGDPVEHALLTALGEVPEDDVDTAIAEAVDAHLLVVDDVAAGYRFRHALLREAVYSKLLPGERRRLHHAVAEAVSRDAAIGGAAPGSRAALLAAQRCAAGEWAEVFAPSRDAAEAAFSALAFRDALEHMERAIVALDRAPAAAAAHGTSRAAVLERAAGLAVMTAGQERAYVLAGDALAQYAADGDVAGAVRSQVLRGYHACYAGLGEEASDRDLEEAVRRSEELPLCVERALALAARAAGAMVQGRFTAAAALAEEALVVARAVESRLQEAHALNTLGLSISMIGRPDEGIALLRESLAIAEDLGDPQAINRGYVNLTHTLMQNGHLVETAAMTYDCAALGQHMWGVRFNGSAGNSIEAMVRLGRYDDALRLIGELGDDALGICFHGPVLWPAPVAVRRGDWERARGLLVEADRLTAGVAFQDRGRFHLASIELALEEGRTADALREATEAFAVGGTSDELVILSELLAHTVRAVADDAERTRLVDGHARARADAAIAELHGAVARVLGAGASDAAAGPIVQGFSQRAEAERSRLNGPDPDLWAVAAATFDAAQMAWDSAYCRWREAEAIVAQGGGARARAADALAVAAETARRLDARPLLTRLEHLAQRARLPLSDPSAAERSEVAPDLGLTPRELEVLSQLVRGSTDREIAEALFISKKTASVHVSNLLRKLDVANRVEAGRVGQEHGVA